MRSLCKSLQRNESNILVRDEIWVFAWEDVLTHWLNLFDFFLCVFSNVSLQISYIRCCTMRATFCYGTRSECLQKGWRVEAAVWREWWWMQKVCNICKWKDRLSLHCKRIEAWRGKKLLLLLLLLLLRIPCVQKPDPKAGLVLLAKTSKRKSFLPDFGCFTPVHQGRSLSLPSP